jgi:glycosyltransferase involved in cell wall biosynthesis
LFSGSERYEYLLSKKLVELGVKVDVFTTRSRIFRQTAAFSSAWPPDYIDTHELIDGIWVERFPVSFHLSPRFGRLVSLSILRRWQREERCGGLMLKGSRNLVNYYHRRALERPLFYDLLMALSRGPHSIRLLARSIEAIHRHDVLLVGFTPFALSWQVVAIARAFKKPVVLLALFHPDDVYHHFRSIYWGFSAADAVLAQTSYSAALLKRMLPRSVPIELGAGVDLDAFADSKVCGARFRTKYGLEGRKLVLFVGRKELSKRYDLAIEAMELINDERVHLVMIGRDIDGHPISRRDVTYLGELPPADLADAYDACDVFVLPSEAESFGMVFLEAWARRKPVIGNRLCQPVACLIADGKDGFLCLDAEEIAAAIRCLLSDPALAQRFGEAGYRKVTARYTWDLLAARVRDLYVQLAGGPAHQARAGFL